MHQINHLNLEQKKRVEITDEARRPNNKYRQIKIRLLMLKSSLFD